MQKKCPSIFFVFHQQRLWQSGVLPPKDEVRLVRIGNFRIDAARLGGEEPAAGAGIAGGKILPVLIIGDVEIVPVIKTGPLELGVIDRKAHRFNQMEPGAGRGAGAGDIPRVLRNPGFQ